MVRAPAQEPDRRSVRRPAALADAAFTTLRADLSAGGPLTARRRIVAGELADRLGMSRTPVREALDRLARLGYLESLEGGGYQRRRYRTRDIRDLYELRLLLEPSAAELAAGQDLWGDLPDGEPFHGRVARASGNRVLAHVVELLAERLAAMRTDIVNGTHHGPGSRSDRASHQAHARIASAIAQGDGAEARQAMDEHLSSEARAVLRRTSRSEGGEAMWVASDR